MKRPPPLTALVALGASVLAISLLVADLGVLSETKVLEMNSEEVSAPMVHLGGTMDHYQMGVWAHATTTLPEDVWVTGYEARVQGAPSLVLHEFYIDDQSKTDPLCPNNHLTIAGGNPSTVERANRLGPAGDAIFLAKGTTLVMHAMFMNYQKMEDMQNYDGVSLRVRLMYDTKGLAEHPKRVTTYLIRQAGCDRTKNWLEVPPHTEQKTYDSRSRPITFPSDGTVLKIGAHFHGSLNFPTENRLRVFFNGKPLSSYTMDHIPDLSEKNPSFFGTDWRLPVKKGDTMWAETTLSNPSDGVELDAMSLVHVVFETDAATTSEP